MTTQILTETEAAELEGLVPATPEQVKLVRRADTLARQIAKLTAERDAIKAEFRKTITENHLQAVTHNGKAIARVLLVNKTKFNMKDFAVEYPKLAVKFSYVATEVHTRVGL
jgi:hypothetical protein